MNQVLENKLHELENASDYECWYLVKQLPRLIASMHI